MNPNKLMQSIGEINNEYIMEAALAKPSTFNKHSLYKILPFVASILVVFSGLLIWNNNRTSLLKEAPKLLMFTVNDKLYEEVTDPKRLKERGLPLKISNDLIGIQIGDSVCTDGRRGIVYDYSGFDGNSILIFESDSNLSYLFYCNEDFNRLINFSDLLSLYGIYSVGNDITVFTSDNKEISQNDALCLVKGLINSNAIYIDEYLNPLNNKDFSDEKLDKKIEITIRKPHSDSLKILYYPEEKVFHHGFTFYQVEENVTSIFE